MSYSLDIAALRTAYENGALTPETVIRDVFRRIAEDGETAVWISLVPEDEALARLARAPKGPLYSIPFAIKDNIDAAGLATTCACPAFATVAGRSAKAVELLEAAGAILIGKCNLDQFATGLNGTRSPYGIPTSPFDAAYISGGSSSGSAVAVAKGLVSFALGTDTAGSGRVPAAFNNIVGLKPTKGVISTRGLVPACRSQDVISIFALTAADAARVYEVVAVFDPEDDYARRAPTPLRPRSLPQGLRIGVPKVEQLQFFGDVDAEGSFFAGVERARRLGCEVVEIDYAVFDETAKLLYAGPWVAERLAAVKELAEGDPDAIEPTVRGIILGAQGLSAVAAFEGFYRLEALKRRAEAEWAKMDVMLLPTAGTTYRIADMLADPVRLNSNLGYYTNFVNLMDLSGFAVPAGFCDNGLPFGVTLIGRAFDDGLLATLGDALHRAVPDISLGATDSPLESTPSIVGRGDDFIEVAVVGAHLSDQPLNWQLTERDGVMMRTARTAPGYSFYALSNTTPQKPGLVFDGRGAGGIEVEVWRMPIDTFGSFVDLVPGPLCIGSVRLADGSVVKGFLCESHGVADATDITATGGWRAWLAAQ